MELRTVGLVIGALALWMPVETPLAQSVDNDDIIESSLRNAIVKIDVSAKTPIVKDGQNVCRSEGTGFFINASHVVTAAHVLQIPPECGERVVLLQSRRHHFERLATLVGEDNDVALLKAEADAPAPICALRMMKSDIYDTKGFRFGIPGALVDPTAIYVKIGPEQSSFSPLVYLTPTPAELGESGGPVISHLNVVGILKAKHQNYIGYSLMITRSRIIDLLKSNHISLDGRACNPADFLMYPIDELNYKAELKPNPELNESSRKEVLQTLKSALDVQRIVATGVKATTTVNETKAVIQSNSSLPQDKDGFVLAAKPDSILNPSGTAQISGRTVAPSEAGLKSALQKQNMLSISEAAKKTQEAVEEALWNAFVEKGTRENKWKD